MSIVANAPGGPLVHAESMDITNDPRFLQDNVIDKRLTAFTGLGVISSLMVGTVLGDIYVMDKDLALDVVDGWVEITAFLINSFILFGNLVAIYVSVAQTYHTYRLMTSGPTGFEMSASYYLHRHMCFWRHFAVKFMVVSLPTFLFSTGLRMFYKFQRAAIPTFAQDNGKDTVPLPPAFFNAHGFSEIGLAVCILYFAMSGVLWYINFAHTRVFRERYNSIRNAEMGVVNHIRSIAQRTSIRLDV